MAPVTTMSRPNFLKAIDIAKPGENITYHVGLLARDRCRGSTFLDVNATACAAWEAMEDGIVLLVQRYIDYGVYEYRARKLAAPHVPVKWTGCYSRPNNARIEKQFAVAASHATAAVTA